jgi:hypothetical protein
LVVLKRILAFVFLRIILNAQTYLDKYLSDIQFNNVYITIYFRQDRREKKEARKVHSVAAEENREEETGRSLHSSASQD